MNGQPDQTDDQDLAGAFLATPASERLAFARSTVRARPDTAEAVARLVMADAATPPPGVVYGDDERLAAVAVEAFRRLRSRPATLLARARALSITPDAVGRQLRLGIDVVVKLDRRLIRPDSIPAELAERLASLLGETVEGVRSMLGGGPRLGAAFYSSAKPPKPQESETFERALARSPATSPDDRAFWQQKLPR